MRPILSELHDDTKFNKIADFHIDDTMKFLMNPTSYGKSEAGTPNKKSQAITGITFFIVSIIFGYIVGRNIIAEGNGGLQLLGGFLAFMVIVLPIHEGIHALVFRSFNANDLGFGFAPKAGMVYAYAQDFPITMRELVKVAIMPFAIITPLLVIGLYVFPSYASVFVFLLIIHTIACIGDFALVKYGYKNKDKEIYTYDDIRNEKRTYYFERK
jgi:hypothetical protein